MNDNSGIASTFPTLGTEGIALLDGQLVLDGTYLLDGRTYLGLGGSAVTSGRSGITVTES